jgi:transcriptional regulator with XRE-family HTH domain
LLSALMYYIVSTMKNDAKKSVKPLRQKALPAELRRALREARENRGWSQRDLASRVSVGQRHISGIESGKIVPRYDTLLEVVRALDRDLLMVPRALVPVVQSLVRDHLKDKPGEGEERPLYAAEGDEDMAGEQRDEV